MSRLTFTKGNAKLNKNIWIFSLPAGHTCPGAELCKAKVVVKNGRRQIADGPKARFRCYAASNEVLYSNVFDCHVNNLKALRAAKSISGMRNLILRSLPAFVTHVRLHSSGDFFSQVYFDAWVEVAMARGNVIFYGYTKSLPYWVSRKNILPSNLILTASKGGRYDALIETENLRFAKVCASVEEAKYLGLPIDHDDSHAMQPGSNFALLLHGIQPKGSIASKYLSKLKQSGWRGYNKKLPVVIEATHATN